MQTNECRGNRTQILSISGGGFRGLYSASVLAGLEERSNGLIGTHFDLIAGTSIGGIIALAIAAEIPATEIRRVLAAHGKDVFGSNPAPKDLPAKIADIARKAFRSPYQGSALRSALARVFPESMRMGDLKHPTIVPAVNLSSGDTQLFKTPHSPGLTVDKTRFVIDVAMATSAAPTYFPIFKMGDSMYADGGLFANAPDLLAWHEAQHFLGAEEKDLHLLSIGTTTSKYSLSSPRNLQFGVIQWVLRSRLASATLASQQQCAQHILTHRLGDRFLKLDQELSSEQEREVGLDVASSSASAILCALADATIQRFVEDARIKRLLSHVPREHRIPPAAENLL